MKFISDIPWYVITYGGSLDTCASRHKMTCVWSISTLHVGPDQADPRSNPNPNPNAKPLGGQARGRHEVVRSSPAIHTSSPMNFTCGVELHFDFSRLRSLLVCFSLEVTISIVSGMHRWGTERAPIARNLSENTRCMHPCDEYHRMHRGGGTWYLFEIRFLICMPHPHFFFFFHATRHTRHSRRRTLQTGLVVKYIVRLVGENDLKLS